MLLEENVVFAILQKQDCHPGSVPGMTAQEGISVS
ncbi:MAG: hypothetical protein JWP12_10 [Bacteroidetes bacterium]|nr:hypothetical protein [Bacteroidota bacterium]